MIQINRIDSLRGAIKLLTVENRQDCMLRYQVWPLPRDSVAGNLGAIESLGLGDGAALQAVARRRLRGRQPKRRDEKESEADLCQKHKKYLLAFRLQGFRVK